MLSLYEISSTFPEIVVKQTFTDFRPSKELKQKGKQPAVLTNKTQLPKLRFIRFFPIVSF